MEEQKITCQNYYDIEVASDNAGIELPDYEELEDLEQKLLQLIIPEQYNNPQGMVRYTGDYKKRVIVANICYVRNSEIIISSGMSLRKKGDKNNYRVGQIIALINAVGIVLCTVKQ